MAVSSIKFSVQVDLAQLRTGLKEAQNSMQDTANTAKSSTGVLSGITNSFKKIGSAALTAVGRIGKMAMAITVFKAVNSAIGLVTGSVGDAISRIDTLNNSNKVFQNMGYSAKETKAMMSALNKSIDGLPTSLDSAVKGVQLIASSTDDLGKSQEIYSAMNNGILGFGGTAEMVDNSVRQLSQAFSNGKVDAETWNSMIDSGMGPVLNALAKKFGMTTGELKKGLSDGTVSVEKFQDGLIELNEKGGGGLASLKDIAKDSTSGIGTSIANMKTAITRGVAEVITGFDKMITSLTGQGIGAWIKQFGKEFEGVLKNIGASMGQLEGPIKSAFPTIKAVFNTLKEIAVTTGEALWEAFQKIGEQVGPIIKQLADMIVDNMDTIQNIIGTVVEVITGVVLGIGDAVKTAAPYFEQLLTFVGQVVDAIQNMLPEGTSLTDVVREWTPKLIAAVAAFKLVKGGVGIASKAVGGLSKAYEGVSKIKTFASAVKGSARAMEKLPKSGQIAVKGLKGLKTGFSTVGKGAKVAGKAIGIGFKAVGSGIKAAASVGAGALKMLWGVIVANPVVAIIVAVIAVFVLLYTKFEWFRDGVHAVLQFIWDVIVKTFTGIVDSAVMWWSMLVTSVVAIVQGLGELLSAIWDGIRAAASAVWNGIVATITAIWNGIKATAAFIWNGIVAVISFVWETIKTAITFYITLIQTVITTAWNIIKTVSSAIWNGIKTVISVVWNAIKTAITVAINVIKTVVTTVWNTIKSVTSAVWNGIKAVISTVWNAIKSAVSSAINAVKSVVSKGWNGIKSVTSSVWNGIKSTISNVWNGIKSGVSNAVNAVKSTVSKVFNGLKSTVTSIWNGIKTAIIRPIEAAKNTVKNIVDKIKGLFKFKLKFPSISIPHIPLPHFKLSGSFNPLKGKIPSVGIDWYKTGGIFTGPSVVGIGENGDEAVLPLSDKSRMAPFASAVAGMISKEDSGSSDGNIDYKNVTLEIPFIVNGKEFYRATIDDLETLLSRRERSQKRRDKFKV